VQTADQLVRIIGPMITCDHLYETTTRYDAVEKVLTFLLVCPVCGTERVLETQHYEPRFQPTAG
jgi:hypothetical protein